MDPVLRQTLLHPGMRVLIPLGLLADAAVAVGLAWWLDQSPAREILLVVALGSLGGVVVYRTWLARQLEASPEAAKP